MNTADTHVRSVRIVSAFGQDRGDDGAIVVLRAAAAEFTDLIEERRADMRRRRPSGIARPSAATRRSPNSAPARSRDSVIPSLTTTSRSPGASRCGPFGGVDCRQQAHRGRQRFEPDQRAGRARRHHRRTMTGVGPREVILLSGSYTA